MSAPAIDHVPPALAEAAPLVAERLGPGGHGDMTRWLAALDGLPALEAAAVCLGDAVTACGAATGAQRERLTRALQALHPWRKGPFSLFGVHVDSEWRSAWKWQRVAPHLRDLAGRRVLDVGCGNGYFGWRMLAAGADTVVGIDPSPLYCLQHRAVARYLGRHVDPSANVVLPLRLEEMPPAQFDSVFSMGVIYHRRNPEAHARELFAHVRPGGEVVVESLIVEGADPLIPGGRYARMRNVHVLPTARLLTGWLQGAGFVDARTVDVTATTTAEQRTTPWMRFESLAEALDGEDPSRTVEGHPAPVRAIVVARKPV